MNSSLLSAASKTLLWVLFVLSLFFLIRGHNDPGGGFIGGLLAASAFTVFALCRSEKESRQVLKISPLTLMGVGFATCVGSGFFAIEFAEGSQEFMKGVWIGEIWLPILGVVKLGTPFLFDVGVYLVVMGALIEVVLRILDYQNTQGELNG